MGFPSCGAEVVVVVRAGEPVPSAAELARRASGVVDPRDLDRTIENGLVFLRLVGRTVLGWEPHGDLQAGRDLEWWTPKDDRASYEALVVTLDGDEEAVFASGETDDFTVVHSAIRPRLTPPPVDPTGPGRPALGRIGRGALILHTHHQPPPYRQRLVMQFAVEIEGRSWVLLVAEGYDVDEWRIFDDCEAVRHPVDDRWPLP